MLDYSLIASYFPPELRAFKRNILREYLQYKTLEAIYNSKYGNKFVFIGGTCLHIVYGNNRFSEDLDFDVFDLSMEEFESVKLILNKAFKLEGLNVEIDHNYDNFFHLKLKFTDILQSYGITKHKEEKLTLKIDSEVQSYKYTINFYLLNRFDVFTNIIVAPAPLLLARKIITLLERVRPMGRDFYDIIFLLGMTEPDMDYIESKTGIKDKRILIEKLIQHCSLFDFDKLANDVRPFLYKPENSLKVKYFLDYLKQ